MARRTDPANPADPYMTLLGYFNSLRELGGARRLIEDEVSNRLVGYGSRKRVGEAEGLFADRKIAYEVVELTSRVSTDKVAEAKRRLSLAFNEKDHVDVAIATNMISVGLDIMRLGLMVVFGQPKTSAEYIQATSRVGRDHDRPGLVVTILNIHKPRDRSHYERFAAYHQSFYRSRRSDQRHAVLASRPRPWVGGNTRGACPAGACPDDAAAGRWSNPERAAQSRFRRGCTSRARQDACEPSHPRRPRPCASACGSGPSTCSTSGVALRWTSTTSVDGCNIRWKREQPSGSYMSFSTRISSSSLHGFRSSGRIARCATWSRA